MGVIYSTNITPDLETGIGHYSLDNFVKVMREGVTDDGDHLYPAMPYTSYAKVSREDLSALYAYFMQGVEPVRQPNHPTKLRWPLSIHSLMMVWNGLYLKKGEYASDANKSVSWNRGAYLVQGLGHCGGCHTPRGVLGQEKAESEKDGRQYLAGAKLDNWYALPLMGDRKTGLNAWSKDEITEYLKTGRTERIAAVGMMAGVVAKSTQYLNDQDLMAIAEYLKTLPPSNDEDKDNADSSMQASKDSAATRALRAGDTRMRGSRVYLDNCNACHRSDGSGAKRTFPNLVKNEAVSAKDPISLIHIVLAGGAIPSTQTAPSAFAMPDFGWRLNDAEIADVLSFIRGNWDNHAAVVSPNEISRVRKALADQ
jgi:mono/diheme cytochrome c family protein